MVPDVRDGLLQREVRFQKNSQKDGGNEPFPFHRYTDDPREFQTAAAQVGSQNEKKRVELGFQGEVVATFVWCVSRLPGHGGAHSGRTPRG